MNRYRILHLLFFSIRKIKYKTAKRKQTKNKWISLMYNKEVYCSVILCVDRLQQNRYNMGKDYNNCMESDEFITIFRFTYHYSQQSPSSTILLKMQRKVSSLVKIVFLFILKLFFFIHFKNVFTRKTIIYIFITSMTGPLK